MKRVTITSGVVFDVPSAPLTQPQVLPRSS
jgi:hypothetical protein